MAQQGSSGMKVLLGLMRRGVVRRHTWEFHPLSKSLESASSSQAGQSGARAFRGSSSSSHGTSLEMQSGAFNSVRGNSWGDQQHLLNPMTKVIRQFRSMPGSFPTEPMKRGWATRDVISISRRPASYDHHGLQRLGTDFKFQHRVLSSQAREAIAAVMKSSRASYHVDNRGMQHFKRRGPASWSENLINQRSMGILLALTAGGVVVYVTNQQTVPYTHRKHFMLVTPQLERSIGDRSYEMIMKEYKNRILPPNHPQSLRVGKVADQIIEALMLGVKASDWGQLDQGAHDVVEFSKEWDKDSSAAESSKGERPLFDPYGSPFPSSSSSSSSSALSHDDSMDEAWVEQSRREGLQAGSEGYTKHLEGMKWKVVVVDDEIVNAVCIPGGKIVVFTGLLKKFRSDTEVATVVAHEVGHAVARHSAEALTHNIFIVALQLAVLSVFYVPGLVNSISELLLRLPFSRRMEIEADHIGLILMAAAGYDPRMAPGFYEKLGKLDKTPEYAQYMSTHPSGKTRGEKLRKTATMEEAMAIYQRKMSGHGTEGFF